MLPVGPPAPSSSMGCDQATCTANNIFAVLLLSLLLYLTTIIIISYYYFIAVYTQLVWLPAAHMVWGSFKCSADTSGTFCTFCYNSQPHCSNNAGTTHDSPHANASVSVHTTNCVLVLALNGRVITCTPPPLTIVVLYTLPANSRSCMMRNHWLSTGPYMGVAPIASSHPERTWVMEQGHAFKAGGLANSHLSTLSTVCLRSAWVYKLLNNCSPQHTLPTAGGRRHPSNHSGSAPSKGPACPGGSCLSRMSRSCYSVSHCWP